MSVVGVDIGTMNTVVAVARNRGIDVITNEVSNRATPTLVSFGSKQRYLGEAAKTQETSNFKNTVAGLKRLVGRPFSDPDVDIERRYVNAHLIEHESGEVGAAVHFMNEHQEFSYTQVLAMFLDKVRQFTSKEIGVPMTDAVISVPGWFAASQRQAILDAASISGINVLTLINELTSSALGYGITKTDLPDPAAKEKPRNVVFIDVGCSSFQVGVVSFVRGKLEVKATAYDRHFGGRNFDDLLLDHFVKEFDAKYKLDIGSSKKALFRLRTGCERVKKILSANSVTMLNIECLLDDKDVSAQVERSDFEAWAQPILSRMDAPIKEALERSGIPIEEIDCVELIGGSTRVPMIRQKISEIFGAEKLATTLNQDEAVSRGAALQCAMISPIFKVRDFAVKDWNGYPIEISWDPSVVPKSGDKPVSSTVEAFRIGTQIPCSRNLTFSRILDDAELAAGNGSVSMDLDISYAAAAAKERQLPETGTSLGSFRISGIRRVYPADQVPEGGEVKAALKVRIVANQSNIVSVESAVQVAEITIMEKVPVEKPKEAETPTSETEKKEGSEEKMDTAAEAQPEMVTRAKKITREYPLKVERIGADKIAARVAAYTEAEGKMAAEDRLAIDTAEKRNSLEEYVYDTRDKLDTTWAEFCDESTKEKFKAALSAMEDWLYTEEGENGTRDVYHNQLLSLKKLGDPIAKKLFDHEESIRIAREKEIAEAKAKAAAEAKAKAEAEAAAKGQTDENSSEKVEAKAEATPDTPQEQMEVD